MVESKKQRELDARNVDDRSTYDARNDYWIQLSRGHNGEHPSPHFPCRPLGQSHCCNGGKYCGQENEENGQGFTEWCGWGGNCVRGYRTGPFAKLRHENRKGSGHDWWVNNWENAPHWKSTGNIHRTDRTYFNWHYPAPHQNTRNGKWACCGIIGNSSPGAWTQNMCKGGYAGKNDINCQNEWVQYCKDTDWNDHCLNNWAKLPNFMPRAKHELNNWCAHPSNKNKDICKCWNAGEFNKYKDEIKKKCIKAGGTASCDYVNQMTPHCTWNNCRNSRGFGIYNNNAAQCPNIEIQNCISNVNAGGNINTDTIVSNCFGKDAVHGGWSNWSDWGQCDKECGGGNQQRTRACNNPPPKNGGKQCEGPNIEERECNTDWCNPLEKIPSLPSLPKFDIKIIILLVSIILIISIIYILIKK